MAVQFCEAAINRGIETDIETGMGYEAEVFAQCFAIEDQKEGMKAFLEKRKPKFVGR